MPEGANIKLASVATGVPGVSGRAMPAALAEGETDPEALAGLARGRVREKTRELQEALRGLMGSRQCFMLVSQLGHLECPDTEIEGLDAEVARRVSPFEATVAAVDTIPGVGRRTAEVVAAEMGTDMERFPTPSHLASWAGVVGWRRGPECVRGTAGAGKSAGAARYGRGTIGSNRPPVFTRADFGGGGPGRRTDQDLPGGPVPAPRPAHWGPAGSGAVESANKLVVEARLKGSGMHWAGEHVNPMVALRTVVCSGRWGEVWPQISRRVREKAVKGQQAKPRAPERPAETGTSGAKTNSRVRRVAEPTPGSAPATLDQDEPSVTGAHRRPPANHPWCRMTIGRKCLSPKPSHQPHAKI